jgi:hypothetical protein
LIIGWKSVALHSILTVGHGAEPKPFAGHGPPLGLKLRARQVLREFERLAGLGSALLATHHARDHARYRKECRVAISMKNLTSEAE